MTYRSLLRRCYGVRLRMLHERTAMWGEAEKLDVEWFCHTGHIGKGPRKRRDDPADHVVNILAYKMSNEGLTIEDSIKLAAKLLGNDDHHS